MTQNIIENHKKLIKILEGVKQKNHNQRTWALTEDEKNPACTTTACALGWAVLSNEFEGLQSATSGRSWAPVIEGKINGWDVAGRIYFGDDTYRQVFILNQGSLAKTIELLQARVKYLEENPQQLVTAEKESSTWMRRHKETTDPHTDAENARRYKITNPFEQNNKPLKNVTFARIKALLKR